MTTREEFIEAALKAKSRRVIDHSKIDDSMVIVFDARGKLVKREGICESMTQAEYEKYAEGAEPIPEKLRIQSRQDV